MNDQLLGANIELLSDVAWIFHLGFATNISASTKPTDGDTSNQAQTMNRLLQGGGMASFSVAYPVLFLSSANAVRQLHAVVTGQVALDAPKLNQVVSTDSAGVAWQLGCDVGARVRGRKGTLGLDAGLYGRYYGFNSRYATRLGQPSESSAGVLGVRAGFVVNEQTSIGVLYPLTSGGGLQNNTKLMIYVQQYR